MFGKNILLTESFVEPVRPKNVHVSVLEYTYIYVIYLLYSDGFWLMEAIFTIVWNSSFILVDNSHAESDIYEKHIDKNVRRQKKSEFCALDHDSRYVKNI